ncbi:PIN domain-containing protein [Methylocystis sp. MJC1]|uniref:PIN domain-containing protein n=1 Tax=Methylocystis sp. MJC1 TaxID=2654282 RepID=UPI0013EE259B|nr:PIN domain-containing protein [Methylocystis sp. MJC1]KAF2992027.1 Ribonuclease VapC2 [Methylocystis sp. MJC1]MBU6525516.1 PIN domain-containing protein [Methylocystis sp. MJC1]UZX12001.1 PIN domain-containing protein [Methylocystis sp. MJC1]
MDRSRVTPRYLLDATVVFAAASGEMATLAKLSRLSISDVAIPALVYCELVGGAATAGKSPRLAENVALLAQNVDILPFDRAAAEAYAAMLRKIEPKRRRMLDRMVAAQAIAEGRILITLAPRDFEDLPDLSLESWAI